MRISDWSSDVCSSDLRRRNGHARRAGDSQPVTDFTEPRFDHPPRPMAQRVGAILWPSFFAAGVATMVFFAFVDPLMLRDMTFPSMPMKIGRASCRDRVCQYV